MIGVGCEENFGTGWPDGDGVAERQYGEYPLLRHVNAFRHQAQRAKASLRPTGLTRAEYLRLADGIVRSFTFLQNARGAILDLYEGVEKQYATPAFACASAILCSTGGSPGLLSSSIRALDWATSQLVAGKAADGHDDFYTVLLMHAYERLRDRAPAGKIGQWQRRIRRIAPARLYKFQPDGEQLHNWNLVAVNGEWMRHRAGLGDERPWIEASLARQADLFTSHGMYRDPGDPIAYDAFARYHVVNLLEQGYDGRFARTLRGLMDRGAWTSLFTQSPHGEIPCGGRSGHHQWNEAAHAMICEVYASRCARRGDAVGAAAFKRSARLALRSLARWVRPSGDLWIVKNRADPSLRHGYEGYSFHSQYNLLTAAMLSIAYLHADDAVDEGACPAEVGGFAFGIQPAFHKVFANAGGMYLEIDTGADTQYNPTGLLRVHHPAWDPGISVSDGVSAERIYETPTPPTLSLSIGPAWRDPEGLWHTLAEHDGRLLRDAKVRVTREEPDEVEFEVAYTGELRGGGARVHQAFSIRPERLIVTDLVEGASRGARQDFPLPVNDGERDIPTEVSGRHAAVLQPDGGGQVYEVLDEGRSIARRSVREPSRNGAFDAAFSESRSPTMRYSLRPIRRETFRD